MGKFDFFWDTMEMCSWEFEGEDDLVLRQMTNYLSKQEDDVIFKFDDLMCELLYGLDTRALWNLRREIDPSAGEDSFLYSRCVGLINGRAYYDRAKNGKAKELWDMEFEALLYVPANAWGIKHRADPEDYPHIAPFSYETGSNLAGWEE